jgi:hypothetical protein
VGSCEGEDEGKLVGIVEDVGVYVGTSLDDNEGAVGFDG